MATNSGRSALHAQGLRPLLERQHLPGQILVADIGGEGEE
jgi:hypothetical protein